MLCIATDLLATLLDACMIAVLQICNDWAAGGKGGLAKIKGDLWNLDTVFLSFLDWPLRK